MFFFLVACFVFVVDGWHWLTIYLAMHLLYSVVLLVACGFYGECFFSPNLGSAWFAHTVQEHPGPRSLILPVFRLHFVFPCFSTITIHLTNLSCSRHSLMIWNRPCFYCMPFGNPDFWVHISWRSAANCLTKWFICMLLICSGHPTL